MRYTTRLAWVLTRAFHALMLEYRSEIYLWVLAHVLPFIMMGLWGLETAKYFVAVFIVRQFTVAWVIYDFEWQMVEGRLSNHLLKPINPVWHFVTAHLAEQLARLPFFAIVLAIVLFFVPQARWTPSVASIVLGIAAIYVAFAVRFTMQYCVCMLTFWVEKASALDQLVYLPYLFLSGLLAPLSMFGPRTRQLVELTPFPYLMYFPARILIGDAATDPISYTEIARGFAISGGYFMLFFILSAWLWKKGLRQYSGMGA